MPPVADDWSPQQSREGHRPFLTPAQALFLARELYGIGSLEATAAAIPPATSGTASAGDNPSNQAGTIPSATELPSYDDRNFRITGWRVKQRPAGRPGEQQPATQVPLAPQPEREGSGSCGGRQEEEEAEAVEMVVAVLKVHNTQDSGRIAQLQAMDAAMRRLQAAGVCTNTPLHPVGQQRGRSVADCGGAPERPDEVAGGGGTGCGDAGQGVPYRVEAPGQAEGEAAPVLCCWALLPCTCHTERARPVAATHGSQGNATRAEDGPQDQPRGNSCSAPEEIAGSEEPQSNSEPTGSRHWHVVRCLTYVPGQMLSSVPYLTPALLLSLGRLMGRVSGGLAGWEPPVLRRCGHDWHPEKGCEVLRRLVPGIAAFDPECRSLLLQVADELAAAGPLLADPEVLPRQVCHADANDDNCVISDDGQEVVGLIDFGDMAVMPRVCEVAITMLYAMLLGLSRPMGPPAATDPAGATEAETGEQKLQEDEEDAGATLRRLLRVAGLVLCGFQQEIRLQREELALLPLLLRGRLAQSLTLGAASVTADPGNAAYLLATQRPGWRVIRLLTHGSVMTDGEMLQHMLAVDEELQAAVGPCVGGAVHRELGQGGGKGI